MKTFMWIVGRLGNDGGNVQLRETMNDCIYFDDCSLANNERTLEEKLGTLLRGFAIRMRFLSSPKSERMVPPKRQM